MAENAETALPPDGGNKAVIENAKTARGLGAGRVTGQKILACLIHKAIKYSSQQSL